METQAFGFRLRANARRAKSDFLSVFKMRSPQCAADPAGAAGRKICDQTINEIRWREEVSMKRRETLKIFGAAAVAAAIGVAGMWNPTDAGYAMVAIAKLVLGGTPIVDGVEIPGLGKAVVDVDNKQIKVKKIMIVNKNTVDGLIKQGL
jgi:hypothetical protein